jgi:hypothetical protein
MNVSRDLLKAIRADLDAAIAAVGQKHGVTLKTGNASFTETSFTFKLNGTIVGAPTVEASSMAMLGSLLGLDPSWVNKPVMFAGKPFVCRGLKSGGRSVLIERQDGKMFRTSVEQFKRGAVLA